MLSKLKASIRKFCSFLSWDQTHRYRANPLVCSPTPVYDPAPVSVPAPAPAPVCELCACYPPYKGSVDTYISREFLSSVGAIEYTACQCYMLLPSIRSPRLFDNASYIAGPFYNPLYFEGSRRNVSLALYRSSALLMYQKKNGIQYTYGQLSCQDVRKILYLLWDIHVAPLNNQIKSLITSKADEEKFAQAIHSATVDTRRGDKFFRLVIDNARAVHSLLEDYASRELGITLMDDLAAPSISQQIAEYITAFIYEHEDLGYLYKRKIARLVDDYESTYASREDYVNMMYRHNEDCVRIEAYEEHTAEILGKIDDEKKECERALQELAALRNTRQ